MVIETKNLIAAMNKGFQECQSVLLNPDIPKEISFIENVSEFPAYSSKVSLSMVLIIECLVSCYS